MQKFLGMEAQVSETEERAKKVKDHAYRAEEKCASSNNLLRSSEVKVLELEEELRNLKERAIADVAVEEIIKSYINSEKF